MATLAVAQEVKRKHAAELMTRTGVYGVVVTKDGGEWALSVYVDQRARGIPKEIEGVKVTTLLSGLIRAY